MQHISRYLIPDEEKSKRQKSLGYIEDLAAALSGVHTQRVNIGVFAGETIPVDKLSGLHVLVAYRLDVDCELGAGGSLDCCPPRSLDHRPRIPFETEHCDI